MKNLKFTANYEENIEMMDGALCAEKNYDILTKDLNIGGRKSRIYVIDGFAKDDTILKMMAPSLSLKAEDMSKFQNIKQYADKNIGYIEMEVSDSLDTAITMLLSGPMILFIEGFSEIIIVDSREYPVRSIQEPDSDKALRGARDGFTETLVLNTAMIRRHIRTPKLATERFSVGKISKTDVVMMYLTDKSDSKLVERLKFKLKNLNINSLTMKQESLSEAMIKGGWFNPFPKVRYTERPDCAAATIDEGGIVIIVDGTPAAMLLPTGLVDFFQDANDYYFPPLVGSYLRILRFIIYFLTLFLIPTWYLLILNPTFIPPWLEFIKISKMNEVPVFFQLMLVELVINCLKQASLNTPSSLGGSFSVVAALLLGDFAVQARWFVPEVLLYMAFVAVANYAQPSYELGYAVKLCRMLLIILTAILNVWGYILGCAIIIYLVVSTPTMTEQSYLYPFIPFNGDKALRAIFRRKMNNENS